MRVLSLRKSPLNIQKCLLPECEFLNNNYGRYCVISQNEYKFIVRIGLCEAKNIHETLFLDDSVLIFSSFEKIQKAVRPVDITYNNFVVLDGFRNAAIVRVVVVFADYLDVNKNENSSNLNEVVKDILKLFVFCSSSAVFLFNLRDNHKFGINCIIIKNVDDTKNGEIFRVDSNTMIIVEKCITKLKFELCQEKENQIQLGGCSRVYNVLKEILDYSKAFNCKSIKFINKLLLIGPQGCGKATLVCNVVSDCRCILLVISANNINVLTPIEMEKKLNSIFEEAKMYAEHKESCVILIEDIDLMSSGRTLHAKRFVGQLINLLESVDDTPGVVVVGTTNNPDEVDSQLRRVKRLEDELEIMIPAKEGRFEIIEKILKSCQVEYSENLLLQVSEWTPGFVGADLKLLVIEALMIYRKEIDEVECSAVIKFLVLDELTPEEIHRKLIRVFGGSALCMSTVTKKVAEFKHCCTFLEDDSKTATTIIVETIKKSARSCVRQKGSLKSIDQNLLRDCFKQALTKVIPSALRGAVGLCISNNKVFSEIGGLEKIKKILDLSVKQQLKNPEKFQKLGVPLTKGILLYGPPGCAKTTLVKALAKECNTTFLATSAADLYSPFVGDAEKKIIQLFTQARIGSPSILFIDEIDAVVGSKSGDRERGVQERILSTLLVEMDGIGLRVSTPRDNSLNLLGNEKEKNRKEMNSGVIVIGATNHPQLLDDALKRPGRFDRLLYVPPPDELERFRILKKLTEKMPLHECVDLKHLAKVTNFYSGADLRNFCQETGLHALTSTNMTAECIHESDFKFVLSKYKPSLNENIINRYESFQKYNV